MTGTQEKEKGGKKNFHENLMFFMETKAPQLTCYAMLMASSGLICSRK